MVRDEDKVIWLSQTTLSVEGGTVNATGIKAGDVDPSTGRKVLYYHDPMVPGNKFDKPGKSPFMDMMMVPVYADGDAGSDGSKVTVSPRIQQNLGVRTAEVTEGLLSPQVSAVGNIAFNERDQAFVQARATGYIERLHVNATGQPVGKGQPLFEAYSPELLSAQKEYAIAARGIDSLSALDRTRPPPCANSPNRASRGFATGTSPMNRSRRWPARASLNAC